MKKLLLILLIFLVGCGNDINKFKNEYEKEEGIEVNISKDSKVKYISAKETVDVLKNKTGILFFGIASDNTTRSVVETLLQVGKDNDLTIYYFDPNTVPDKDNDENFAKELASRNIRANAVAPGFIETDMTSVLSDSVKENISTQIPLKRMGTAREVAEVIYFLGSDKSSYITGQVINIDGGMVM